MVWLNRLNNGVGTDRDFALYLPQGVDILMKSSEFRLADDEIPQKLKQGHLKLLYRPNVYIIRRNKENGKIVLTDISTHETELPTCLAAYSPEKVCPEILFHGFMLCADKNLGSLSLKNQEELTEITSHFQKLIKCDMKQSARHELKHLENSIYFNEVHQAEQAFTHEHYIRKCFLDEISATIQENIEAKVKTKEDGLAYVKQVFAEWMNTPRHKSYYDQYGDFEHQYSVYEDKTHGRETSSSAQMYQQIAHKFFTFKINGQETDLSAAINPYFALPQQSMQNLLDAQKFTLGNDRR